MTRVIQLLKKVYRSIRSIYYKFAKEVIRDKRYGLKFNISAGSDRYVFKEIFGNEDAYRREQIVPLMQAGTVVEIGAHKGFFTLLAATLAKKVIAYEPDAVNFEYLKSNIALNAMQNVVAVNKAVSDKEETKTFTVSQETAARHTLHKSTFSGEGVEVRVECTTLEAVFLEENIQRLALLKMDCEGSEYDIIYNTDRSIFQQIDAVAMEIHEIDKLNHKKVELVEYMENLGFVADIYDERWLETLHVWMALFTRNDPQVS